MNRHVISLFYRPHETEEAVDALIAAGIERGEMSMLINREQARQFELMEATALAEGTAGDAVFGGTLGLGAAQIATSARGEGILAVGPLLVALASLGVNDPSGGIAGALIGVGIPEHEARFYEQEILDRGAALLGVATLRHDEARVASILLRHRAVNITRSA